MIRWIRAIRTPAAGLLCLCFAACGTKADLVVSGGVLARGGLVLPGFVDGHTHFVDGGFQLASVDLRDAATPAEFIRRIQAYARTLKPGEWILGGDWDHTRWPGQRLP